MMVDVLRPSDFREAFDTPHEVIYYEIAFRCDEGFRMALARAVPRRGRDIVKKRI
jgi:hypothetical protein